MQRVQRVQLVCISYVKWLRKVHHRSLTTSRNVILSRYHAIARAQIVAENEERFSLSFIDE